MAFADACGMDGAAGAVHLDADEAGGCGRFHGDGPFGQPHLPSGDGIPRRCDHRRNRPVGQLLVGDGGFGIRHLRMVPVPERGSLLRRVQELPLLWLPHPPGFGVRLLNEPGDLQLGEPSNRTGVKSHFFAAYYETTRRLFPNVLKDSAFSDGMG